MVFHETTKSLNENDLKNLSINQSMKIATSNIRELLRHQQRYEKLNQSVSKLYNIYMTKSNSLNYLGKKIAINPIKFDQSYSFLNHYHSFEELFTEFNLSKNNHQNLSNYNTNSIKELNRKNIIKSKNLKSSINLEGPSSNRIQNNQNYFKFKDTSKAALNDKDREKVKKYDSTKLNLNYSKVSVKSQNKLVKKSKLDSKFYQNEHDYNLEHVRLDYNLDDHLSIASLKLEEISQPKDTGFNKKINAETQTISDGDCKCQLINVTNKKQLNKDLKSLEKSTRNDACFSKNILLNLKQRSASDIGSNIGSNEWKSDYHLNDQASDDDITACMALSDFSEEEFFV